MSSLSRKHIPMVELIQIKRLERFEQIDNLPPDLRALTNDYGWNIVNQFMGLGVKKAKHIRHLVETVLDEFSPTRGSFSKQGVRTEHHDKGEVA